MDHRLAAVGFDKLFTLHKLVPPEPRQSSYTCVVRVKHRRQAFAVLAGVCRNCRHKPFGTGELAGKYCLP
jgi:hypothetical protein